MKSHDSNTPATPDNAHLVKADALFGEAFEMLLQDNWYLAYEAFRSAAFAALATREAEHADTLPQVLEAADWLGLGPEEGRRLCSALELNYRMASIMGGCYHDTFKDLYGNRTSAWDAMEASAEILRLCGASPPRSLPDPGTGTGS